MGAQGTTTVDFGPSPGTNQVTASVVGQTGLLAASSLAEAWIGNGSTADHNAYEHDLLARELSVRAGTLVDDVGFTITASTQLRLTGLVQVAWVWN